MCIKARWYAMRAGRPDHGMVFLGVTGTDGKSTTSACLYHMLKSAGYRVGIISTVLIDSGTGVQNNETHMTSLPHHLFWDYLSQAKENGVRYMVIEDSSHSLRQYRTRPIRYMGVGITNLSREHLDFHRTMEHYAKTKAELFGRLVEGGTGVVPHSYPYMQTITHSASTQSIHRVTFGGHSTDLSPDICVSGVAESPFLSFDLHMRGQESIQPIHIDSRALGRFNADNMMIASALAQLVGCSLKEIKNGLESFGGLPGRQELVQTVEGITAMIDFALTPDALRTVYMASRGMGFSRLIVIFGATGNRDQGKRPEMGRVAAECADVVIVTEDENYHEDGMAIMRQIEEGIVAARDEGSAYMGTGDDDGGTDIGMSYELVQDRTQAISRGLELAQAGDVVIVTGMANFTSRAMNEGDIDWDERAVIEGEMRRMGYRVKG